MTAYDAIAGWYDRFLRDSPLYREVVLPSLLGLIGDVSGQAVCDLACGQGWVARELARRGAHVTGVDLSASLLGLARRYEQEEPLGISYVRDDAQTLGLLQGRSFDGVVCTMALMNIPDVPATARAVRRVLSPGGWFVTTITHPCFQTPETSWVTKPDGRVVCEVAAYFDERYWTSDSPDSVRRKVGDYHRTLGTYLNTFAGAGFILERVDEPRASGRRLEQVPGNREAPSILSLRFGVPAER